MSLQSSKAFRLFILSFSDIGEFPHPHNFRYYGICPILLNYKLIGIGHETQLVIGRMIPKLLHHKGQGRSDRQHCSALTYQLQLLPSKCPNFTRQIGIGILPKIFNACPLENYHGKRLICNYRDGLSFCENCTHVDSVKRFNNKAAFIVIWRSEFSKVIINDSRVVLA